MVDHVEGIAEVHIQAVQVLLGVVGVFKNVDVVSELALRISAHNSPLLTSVDDLVSQGMVHHDVGHIAGPQLIQGFGHSNRPVVGDKVGVILLIQQ